MQFGIENIMGDMQQVARAMRGGDYAEITAMRATAR